MSEQIRLGDLLTRAGLLRPEDLREGMLIAKQQSLPVGRVLIMAEFISEPNLQAAVQAQSMLKDGVIDIDTALSALQISARGNISLDEALNQCGWKDKTNSATNKLGGVLTEAGLISDEQLKQGLNQCQMSGLPLGRVLVAMGFMSEALLAAALNAQILIRDSKIQRDLAIQGLRACHERQISIEQSLGDAGLLQMPVQDTVRLGELFVMANLLDQDNLMQAVELGLTESKPIGQVLVERNMVSEQLLESALAVQRLVAEGKIKKEQCGLVLSEMSTKGLTMDEALKRLEPPKPTSAAGLPLYQFLQLAGLINAKDIEEALKQGSRDTELMGRMLLLTQAIDQTSLTSAVRLNEMVTNNVLKTEQAILAMGLCQNRNCSVEQAFKSLGWGMALDQANREHETIPPASALANTLTQQVGQGQAHAGQSGSYQAIPPAQDIAASGQYQALGQPQLQGGQQFQQPDPTASGQFQQLASGQYPSLQQPDPNVTGQYPSLQQPDPNASGQYQQLGSGQYPAVPDPGASGQYAALGQSGQYDALGQSGQYQALGQSGQYDSIQQQSTSGDHLLGLAGANDASQTATSDVPIITSDSLMLQQTPVPTAFDEPPTGANAGEEAGDQEEQDQEQDDASGGSGKKKKGKGGGGGGKKRLADLMP
jgi:hypothetical protein